MADIKIKKVSYTPFKYFSRGNLKLLFSGEDINPCLMNSMRRILTEEIPVHAYPPELIEIKKADPEDGYNNSVAFNNDYMKLRLSQLPIFDLDSGLHSLHEKYWKGVNYIDKTREKHKDEKTVTTYVSVKNDTNDIIHVTTNDMKVYVDGDAVEMYSEKYPILLISLNPKEEFECSMEGVLGVGLRHAIWYSASNCYYDYETYPGKYLMTIESSSRFNEFVLFKKMCKAFKEKIKMMRNEIVRIISQNAEGGEEKNNELIEINLRGESFTMGGSINYELQSHPGVAFSGVSKRDYLENSIQIKIKLNESHNLESVIREAMDNLLKKVKTIEKSFEKIKV